MPLIKILNLKIYIKGAPLWKVGQNIYQWAHFSKEDHERLYKVLKNVKGRFLLSYNDCEYIRELFSGFKIEAVKRNNNLYNRYADGESQYYELIISNY